jgi:uncharacterized protein YjbJ (UPF0337 family)
VRVAATDGGHRADESPTVPTLDASVNKRGRTVFKSARRNKTEGAVDRLAGRVLEVVGKVTGRKSHKAKGKAARARGSARKKRGQAKKTVRR